MGVPIIGTPIFGGAYLSWSTTPAIIARVKYEPRYYGQGHIWPRYYSQCICTAPQQTGTLTFEGTRYQAPPKMGVPVSVSIRPRELRWNIAMCTPYMNNYIIRGRNSNLTFQVRNSDLTFYSTIKPVLKAVVTGVLIESLDLHWVHNFLWSATSLSTVTGLPLYIFPQGRPACLLCTVCRVLLNPRLVIILFTSIFIYHLVFRAYTGTTSPNAFLVFSKTSPIRRLDLGLIYHFSFLQVIMWF
jgi:hypothetical protein